MKSIFIILIGMMAWLANVQAETETLEGTTATLQGDIIAHPRVVFNQNMRGAFRGKLKGDSETSELVIKGGGKVYFLNDSSEFKGITHLAEGSELAVNGTLGGKILIHKNASLSGIGTVDTIRNQEGCLSPGDRTMGIFRTLKDYLHDPKSIFSTKVNKAGESSQLQVGGEVVISENKGTIEIKILDEALIGPRYTIIHADNGLNGTFDKAVVNNKYYRPILSYDNNNAYVTFKTNFGSFCKSANQSNVAKQFDDLQNATSNHHKVIHSLSKLPHDEMQQALDQLSGQQYANLFIIPELANRRLLYQLYYPARPGSYGCDCENPSCGELEVWSEFQGGRSFIGSNQHAKGFDFDSYGIILGAQKYYSSCLLAGIAGAYEHEHIEFDLEGSGNSHTYQGAVYAVLNTDYFYLFSDATLGATSFKLRRNVDFELIFHKPHCKPHIWHGAVYTELGTSFVMDCLLVQPFMGGEWGFYRRNQFREHGAGNFDLHVNLKDVKTFDSRLGFHIMANLPLCFMLNADLAWQHRYRSMGETIKAHFDALGQEFTIKGVTIGRNSLQGSINIAREVAQNWTVFLEFSGEKWNKFTTYDFGIGLMTIW